MATLDSRAGRAPPRLRSKDGRFRAASVTASPPPPPPANSESILIARGPRARRLQAEFGSAVSAVEAEQVIRYAAGDVELASWLLRNKLGLPRKRKRDRKEETHLSWMAHL